MTGLAGLVVTSEIGDLDPVFTMLRAMGRRSGHSPMAGHSGHAMLGAGHLSGRPPEGFVQWEEPGQGGTWLICAQTRLDNLAPLDELGDPTASAAALILKGYQRWGSAVTERLNGDFAFAIWDPRAARLFFARDRFGVMPFYYSSAAGRFAFASEPKAILALAGTPRRVPRIRLAEFMAGLAPPEDETFFADVRRLPPGSCGSATAGGCRTWRYWRMSLPDRGDIAEPAAVFAELFKDAVERRLTGGHPTAAMLSGGLDSSAICAVAARSPATPAPLRTASMTFGGRETKDETPFIEAVLSGGDYDPVFEDLSGFDPFHGFQAALEAQDGLFLAPGLTLNRHLYRHVAAGGVILNGHGGDEVVSTGSGHLHDLARSRSWRRLWTATKGAADIYGTSRLALFLSFIERYGPGRYKIKAVRRAFQAGKSDDPLEGLSPGLRRDYEAELAARGRTRPGGKTGRALDFAVVSDPLQSQALDILDRESAAAGVESRYPFWDADLVRFSLSLDPGTKLQDGWSRMLLRKAMQDYLPDKIRWRRDKYDFSYVIVRNMLKSPAASQSRLGSRAETLGAYVDLDRVEAGRARLAATRDPGMNVDATLLWRTTALAEWLDYADRKAITLL